MKKSCDTKRTPIEKDLNASVKKRESNHHLDSQTVKPTLDTLTKPAARKYTTVQKNEP